MFDKEEEKAKKLDQGGIRLLWQDIKEGKALDWEAGRALEYLIIRAWQLDAAADTEIRSVSWPFVVTYPQKIGPVE